MTLALGLSVAHTVECVAVTDDNLSLYYPPYLSLQRNSARTSPIYLFPTCVCPVLHLAVRVQLPAARAGATRARAAGRGPGGRGPRAAGSTTSLTAGPQRPPRPGPAPGPRGAARTAAAWASAASMKLPAPPQ